MGDSEDHFIPLAQLADIFEDPHRLLTECGGESALKSACVGGPCRFVARRDGCWVSQNREASLDWGDKFQQLESAGRRLLSYSIALLLIFVLLCFNYSRRCSSS